MDQCMINVSGIEDAAMLDEVTLLGRQGDEMISAGEWAAQLGTIEYEVPCMITRRVPRVYIKDGQIVDIVNRLSR
jgi:alanine racemase